MKRCVFLTLTFLIAASNAAATGVHIVGGGTPNSNNTYPFWGIYPAFRWQTMWFQSELGEAGPVIKIEWQTWNNTNGGSYSNCDILLCHTNVKALTSTFATNYGGNTPVNVFKGTYTLSGYPVNTWVTIVEPKNFNYNNKDNLLMEVSWQGGSGRTNSMKVRNSGSPPFPGRIWNTSSKTATTGSVQASYHHYGRITIGYVGVAATSLGRVKSLFR
ncbi:MAG: hypothetical protein GTN49_11455 [candidate division Zixibacteria bacterium]|nr:hypothetical protein [candidate division Zixibacteria bacterium]